MLANFGTEGVKRFFQVALQLKPSLIKEIESATTSKDIEKIFSESVDIIDASSGTGTIDIDGALLEAIRGAKFDHADGTVDIANTTVKASVLVTGGSDGATGQTKVGGNTSLKSQGTEIRIGKDASIKISGNASIKQS